jgi:acylphosphatase
MLLQGRVQGVGFRWYVSKRAASWASIRGYVRNTPDGDVEVVAEGPLEDLAVFADQVAKGPSEATVVNIRKDWSDSLHSFHIFEIRM